MFQTRPSHARRLAGVALAASLVILGVLGVRPLRADTPGGARSVSPRTIPPRAQSGVPRAVVTPAPATPADTMTVEAPRAVMTTARLDAFGFPSRPYAVERIDVDEAAPLAETFEAVGLAADAAERLADWATRDLGLARFEADHVLHVYREGTRLSHLVYEEDLDSYVVLKPGVLPIVRRLNHPAEYVERADALVLRGSLTESVRRAGLPAALADSLRAAFGSRMRYAAFPRGAALSLVLEEERVGGVVLATRVKAIRVITGAGVRHEAFRVEGDSLSGFYDGEGRSYGDLFLRLPLDKGFVSSHYSMRRLHPVDSVWRPHLGTDFAASMGAPVYSVGDGVVLEAGTTGGNGNYVKVRHDDVYTTGYLHFSKIAPGIRPGVRVRQGQVIGYVGMTGLATGPHVCFRYYKHGNQIDFLAAAMPPAPPIAEALRPAFLDERDRLRRLFDGPTLADQVLTPLAMPETALVPSLALLRG